MPFHETLSAEWSIHVCSTQHVSAHCHKVAVLDGPLFGSRCSHIAVKYESGAELGERDTGHVLGSQDTNGHQATLIRQAPLGGATMYRYVDMQGRPGADEDGEKTGPDNFSRSTRIRSRRPPGISAVHHRAV